MAVELGKPKPSVSVFMDVEDPVNERSDDAALDLARLFTDVGIRGSFCVTGEKCRTLVARGRQDVLDALRPHGLGLHTDTHSVHPTTMELLADCSWTEGCRRALETEGRGCNSFRSAFARSPAFWGGAGNTWSPEITDALKRLGIPAYVYALTEVPGLRAHRFNGVLAFSQTQSISELDWADDARAARRTSEVLKSIGRAKHGHQSIFVGHPTKLRHARYWDEPYFAGRNPERPEPSEPLPVETYERSKRNLAEFLRQLSEFAEVQGIDEAIQQASLFREPTDEERAQFEVRTTENLRAAAQWPVHRPGLNAERIVEKTLDLVGTLEVDCGGEDTPASDRAPFDRR